MTLDHLSDAGSGDPASNTDAGSFPGRLLRLIGRTPVRAFARETGISEGVLRKYLSNKSDPSRTRLITIAEAGGVSLEWLATGQGPMTPQANAQPTTPNAKKETQPGYTTNANDGPGTTFADALEDPCKRIEGQPLDCAQLRNAITIVYDLQALSGHKLPSAAVVDLILTAYNHLLHDPNPAKLFNMLCLARAGTQQPQPQTDR